MKKATFLLVSCGLSEVGRIDWREKGPMLACYMAGRTRAFICWCAKRVTPKMLRIWGCTGIMRGEVYTYNKAETWCEKGSQSFPTAKRVQKKGDILWDADGRLCTRRGLDQWACGR